MATFIAAFMVAPTHRIHHDWLYFFVLVPFFFAVRWTDVSAVFSSRVFVALALLFTYLLSTLAWSGDVGSGDVYDYTRRALAALMFVIVVAWVFSRPKSKPIPWAAVLSPVAIAVFVYSFFVFYAANEFPVSRLNNLAYYHSNPLAGSTGFAIAALLLMGVVTRVRGIYLRGFVFLGIAACVAFLLFAQARGPLIAVAAGFAVQLGFNRQWKYLGGLALLSVLLVLLVEFSPWGGPGFVERGDSQRFAIWAATLEEVRERPFLGHGIASSHEIDLPSGRTHVSPHSLWFNVTRSAGVVGLGLLGLVLALAVKRLLVSAKTGEVADVGLAASVLVAGLLMASLDSHAIIGRVHPHLWLGLWFPLGLIMGLELRDRITLMVRRESAIQPER